MVDNCNMGTGWAGQKSAMRQSPASPHIRMEMWVLDWVQQAQETMTQQTKPFSENTVFTFCSLAVSRAGLGGLLLCSGKCYLKWVVRLPGLWWQTRPGLFAHVAGSGVNACDRKKSLVTLWAQGWCGIPCPEVPTTCYHRTSRCMHQTSCARFGLLLCPMC